MEQQWHTEQWSSSGTLSSGAAVAHQVKEQLPQNKHILVLFLAADLYGTVACLLGGTSRLQQHCKELQQSLMSGPPAERLRIVGSTQRRGTW